MTAKTPAKVHLRLRFQNLGKPRTAGLCGRTAGACDCGPLSCYIFERVNRGRKSPKRDLAGRENPSPKAQFPFAGAGFTWAFRTSPTNAATFVSRGCGGYTLAFTNRIAHSGLHAETGAFRTGVVSLPSDRSARFGNPAWPGGRAANFAVFGSWPGALPKNAESLRNSDALMRVAVPRRRGPAGLRDPVAIVSMIKNMINPWAGSFLIFCWANANSIKKVVLQPF